MFCDACAHFGFSNMIGNAAWGSFDECNHRTDLIGTFRRQVLRDNQDCVSLTKDLVQKFLKPDGVLLDGFAGMLAAAEMFLSL